MDSPSKTVVVIRSAPSSAEFKRGLKLAELIKASGQQVRLCLLSGAVLATAELSSRGWDSLIHKDSAQMRALELSGNSDKAEFMDYAQIVDLLVSDNSKVIGAF